MLTVGLRRSTKVIAEQSQNPLGEVARGEQVVAVVVDGELGTNLQQETSEDANGVFAFGNHERSSFCSLCFFQLSI